MNSKSGWIVGVVCAVLVALGVMLFAHIAAAPTQSNISTSTGGTMALPEILPGVTTERYASAQYGFTIDYPASASVRTEGFDAFLPRGSAVVGIALPQALFSGTNLREAGVYVGATSSAQALAHCTKAQADNGEKSEGVVSIHGTEYQIVSLQDAGAGNLYSQKIYRTLRSGTCFEIATLLHSTQLANYPEGTVAAFDEPLIQGYLDAIVQTIAFQPER